MRQVGTDSVRCSLRWRSGGEQFPPCMVAEKREQFSELASGYMAPTVVASIDNKDLGIEVIGMS